MNTGSPEFPLISQEARNRFHEKYRLSGSTNPHEMELAVRRFIGDSLKGQSEDRRVVLAAIQFGQLAFDLETGLGKPDYITKKAQRNAEKLGLSPEEIELTREKAAGLYIQFKVLSGSVGGTQTSTEVLGRMVDVLETARKLEAEAEQRTAKEKRGRLRLGLERRFQNLMGISDEELRIQLCNERVNLKDNPVYRSVGVATREAIQARALGRDIYKEKLREVRGFGNVIVLNLRGVKQDDVLVHAGALLDNVNYLVHDVAPDKIEEFSDLFRSLLTGVRVSKVDIEKRGIDPDILQSKAHSFLTNYKIHKAEEAYIQNPGRDQMRVNTRRGTDPHVFLGDGSHRKFY